MRWLKSFIKKYIIKPLIPRKAILEIKFLGKNKYMQFFIFQRILRINSHVPWPIHMSSVIGKPQNIFQEERLPFVGFHPGTYVNATNKIYLGKNVRIGPRVSLISGNHDMNNYPKQVKGDPIRIGNNCWLGANVVILPEVNLGNHVVVAAGSVVTKSFGDNVVIGGIPARVLRELEAYNGNENWTQYILNGRKETK
jgi:NDP-sugar pyrophosphorylase family protein